MTKRVEILDIGVIVEEAKKEVKMKKTKVVFLCILFVLFCCCEKSLPTSPDIDPIINPPDPPAQLVASCSASVTEGEAPLTIEFIGAPSGGVVPYSYSWDFGDGETSDLQNPEHEYLLCGSYIVIFTVTDSKNVQANAFLTIKLYSAHKVKFVAKVFIQNYYGNLDWTDAFTINLSCDDHSIQSITHLHREQYNLVGEVSGSIWSLYPGQHTFTFELVESLWGTIADAQASLRLSTDDTTIVIAPTEMYVFGGFEWEVGERIEYIFTITETI